MDLRVKVRVSVRFGGAIRNSSLESFLLVFVKISPPCKIVACRCW